MKTRIISGIVMAVIAFVFINLGSWPLCAGLCIIACIGYRELLEAMGIIDSKDKAGKKSIPGVLGIGYVCTAALYFCTYAYCATTDKNIIRFFQKPLLMMGIVMIPFFVFAIYYVLNYPKLTAPHVMGCYFAYMYVPVLLSYLYTIRENTWAGKYIIWLVIIAASGTDVFAYFTGTLIGKHKLAPVLSPKKSVEGAVGGVAGAIVLAILFGLILTKFGIELVPNASNRVAEKLCHYIPLDFAIICGVASVISQFGDLLASGIKRYFNIKDYGNLIPGHGGVLDRFDSIIFVAPVVYMLSVVLF